MSKRACAIALAWAATGFASLATADIGGRYAAAAPADAPGATGSAGAAMRVVEITAHRNAYSVTYAAAGSRGKRRGWGLLDGDQFVVALSTGGAAYGVAVYHYAAGEHAWSGPWISSLDGGASLGKIRFEEGATLEGRHALFCARPGAGSVSGTVEIKPAAGGYQLTFQLGRAVYYRGVGLLLPGDRLAVGWSFGSAPELATYQVAAGGSLTEHRISWTPHADEAAGTQLTPINNDQYLAAMNPGTPSGDGGSSQMPLFTNPAGPPEEELPAAGAPGGSEAAPLILGPAAPQVKAWSYGALMRQYGADGWAERWLERQLKPEELRLLHAALRRRGSHGSAGPDVESRSIGTLIEDERAKEIGR
jgi:hypothetical protein